MRKNIKSAYIAAIITASLSMAACGANAKESSVVNEVAIALASTESSTETTAMETSTTQASETASTKSIDLADEDYETSYDASATKSTLSDGNIQVDGSGVSVENSTLTITKGGTYVVSGTLSDGSIQIAVGDTEKVHLVLNGVNIHNESGAAIAMTSGEKLIVTLEGSNTLSDSTDYVFADGEDEPDATLFVKTSLTINGSGSLTVDAKYAGAIKAKDHLAIVSGDFTLHAADNAIKGKDGVIIADGDITIDATGKGITSEGEVYIYDGTIDIKNSEEGLEGLVIEVYGGDIRIVATDDGINARVKADDSLTEQEKEAFSMLDQDTSWFKITGGKIVVLSTGGDGLDSNGDVYVEGGTLIINGPTGGGNGSLDYNGEAMITGGEFVAFSAGDMVQTFAESSTQNTLNINFTNQVSAGSEITIIDASGDIIYTVTAQNAYSNMILSLDSIKEGETYTVKAGDESIEVTAESGTTTYGTSAGRGMGGGPRGGGLGSENGERPTPPEGFGGKSGAEKFGAQGMETDGTAIAEEKQ